MLLITSFCNNNNKIIFSNKRDILKKMRVLKEILCMTWQKKLFTFAFLYGSPNIC